MGRSVVAMVGPATTGWLGNGAPFLLRAGNRSQNRDFLLHSDFAARYFNTVPKRAALARIPCICSSGQPGAAGAAHRYPD